MTFKVYIPARYGATRLPGKPLLEIHGKPLIQHVYERAVASGAAEVVIATDDERIAAAARAFGATACMTAPALPSGSDRIAAAARQRGESRGPGDRERAGRRAAHAGGGHSPGRAAGGGS
jgi:3-deoxy-manno-octulosonate cytidylyltransferase (CMP-KDO synthetase)